MSKFLGRSLVIFIFKDCLHLYCYLQNVSTAMSTGLLQVFVKLGNPRGFNKGHSSKFREGSRVQQTPEEGRRTYRSKRCRNNNKDEDNSPKTLKDNNFIYLVKFRETINFAPGFLQGFSKVAWKKSICLSIKSSLFISPIWPKERCSLIWH